MPTETPTTVTVARAADLLSVTTATIYTLLARGRLARGEPRYPTRITLDSVDAEFARRYPGHVRVNQGG